MTRQEFLHQLGEHLHRMEEKDREEVLRYFDELIQDKAADSERAEDEVILDLGPVDAIARAVLDGESQKTDTSQTVNREESDSEPVTKTSQVKAAQVRELVVRAYNLPVTISPGASEEISLTYPQSEEICFDLTLQDGLLQLVQQKNGVIGLFRAGWWLGTTLASEIILTLPKDFAGKLDVQTSNGNVVISSIDVWGSLRLYSSNGRIDTLQCRARTMDIHSANGRLTAQDVGAQGDITLKTSNGRIEANNVNSGGGITLHSSNGSLRFSRLKANALMLITSNSTIEGSIDGSAHDYTVNSSTSNGKNNLTDHAGAGPKHLEARTNNGSIRVQFEKQ